MPATCTICPRRPRPASRFADAVQAAAYKLPQSDRAARPRGGVHRRATRRCTTATAASRNTRSGRTAGLRGQARRTKAGGVVTTMVDISEVKRREKEATDARAVLQSVFDNHERRRAALRGRRPLGLPEPGDGQAARHVGRAAGDAADLRRHRPLSRAARRLRAARGAAGRARGLDRKPRPALHRSPTSRPSGGAPRPAAPSR